MDFEIISCGRTNPNGSSLPFPFVGRWVARGYKSQSKGGSGAGLVGDDGDNGENDNDNRDGHGDDDDDGDSNCLHPPLDP